MFVDGDGEGGPEFEGGDDAAGKEEDEGGDVGGRLGLGGSHFRELERDKRIALEYIGG